MMKRLPEHHLLMEAKKAEETAMAMNADEDDDWEYVVIHPSTNSGKSIIAAYDEDGEFVHYV